jgi:predicted RNA binding protein YcfA (HicA-like mRNA interferase family)
VKVRDLLRLLQDDGWVIDRTRGSHRQLRHPSKQGTVTVSGHLRDDVHPKTLKSARCHWRLVRQCERRRRLPGHLAQVSLVRNPLMIQPAVSHDLSEETMEAKARWFQSLTLKERMDMLCAFTDLALSANPRIVDQKHAEPVAGRVRVLTKA